MLQIVAVVLAAGKSTRMKSEMNKVLLPILGKPMIRYQIDAFRKAKIKNIIIVVGHQAEEVKKELGDDVEYVFQKEQLGTGHALRQAEEKLGDFGDDFDLVVTMGDNPYLQAQILEELISHHRQSNTAATFITAIFESPPPYGRVIRGEQGRVIKIVEDIDASSEQVNVKEVNSSIYCFKAPVVLPLLSEIKNNNLKREYYLTDIIEILTSRGYRVEALISRGREVPKGINTREELALAEKELKGRKKIDKA